MNNDQIVTLSHGSGGKKTSALIDEIFKKHFENPLFTADDGAVFPIPSGKKLVMSTDGFIVSPSFFPGGDIGKLSICGTVNDIACMGATPLYLTASFIIEEGFLISDLERIVSSMEETAKYCNINIIAGDTKVTEKGKSDGIFITTTGFGVIDKEINPSGSRASEGDSVIITGDIGRHGAAILVSRNDFSLSSEIKSDCAPLNHSIRALLSAVPDTHVIRDCTRGGTGTVLFEIARQSDVGIQIERESLPVSSEVKGICSLLGFDPLYLACEGRAVAIVKKEDEEKALSALRSVNESKGACVIGRVVNENKGIVTALTTLGTEVFIPEPGNELLPRIC